MKKRHMSRHHPSKKYAAPLMSMTGDWSLPKISPLTAGLCVLAFVIAVLGVMLAYAGGDASYYFPFDHVRWFVKFYLWWTEHGFNFPTESNGYPQLFPDTFVPMLLSLLFHNPSIGIYGNAIFNWLMMAVGAFLLARRCGAGGLAWLAWPLVGLMALLVVLDSTEEIFVTAIVYGFRSGLNAMILFMLWLALSVLFASSPKIAVRYAVAFAILLVPLIFSYIILPAWFVLPLVLTVALALVVGWLKFAHHNWKILAAALLAGYLLESALHDAIVNMFYVGETIPDSAQGGFSWSIFAFSLRQFLVNWGANIVVKHPFLSLAWVGFLVAALWAVYTGIFRRAKGKTPPVPVLCALSFLLFVIATSLATTLVLSQYYLWGRWWHFANHRYFMPAIYIPLFLGLPILLAYYLPMLRHRFAQADGKIFWAINGLAAVVLVCALPLFRHLPQVDNLATYTSPFLACAGAELEKRGLKSGIGPMDLGNYLDGYLSYTHGIKTVPVFNTRAVIEIYQKKDFPVNQPPFRPSKKVYKMPKDIDFAVANWTDERKTMQAPETSRCPWRLEKPQECYDYQWTPHAELFIKSEHITDYYGMPKETFRCEGVDFLVYQ